MAKTPPRRTKSKTPPPAKRVPKRKLTPKVQATPRQVDLEEAIAAKKAVKIDRQPLRPASKPTPHHVSSAVERAIARAEGRELPEPDHPSTVPYSEKSRETLLKGPAPGAASTPPPPPPVTEAVPTLRGRPSKYEPEFAERAKEMCERGATDYDLAEEFEVNVTTIWRWQTRYDEFCNALKAKAGYDDRVERSLAQRAVGYTYDTQKVFCFQGTVVRADVVEHVPPDPGACKLWLAARKPKEWRETQRLEHTGRDGGPIETVNRSDMVVARRLAFAMARALSQPSMVIDVEPAA